MARGLAFKYSKYSKLKKKYSTYAHATGVPVGKVISAPCPCSCPKCGKNLGHSYQYYKADQHSVDDLKDIS